MQMAWKHRATHHLLEMCSQCSLMSWQSNRVGRPWVALGTRTAQYRCRAETDSPCWSSPLSLQRGKPSGALQGLTIAPCLRSSFILSSPQSTLAVTRLPASLCKTTATGSVIPSTFTPSCCRGVLLRGKGKDSFPLCHGCPTVTEHQRCIPKPAPAAGQRPQWMAQLPSAKTHQGVPRPLTHLRRCAHYS